MATVTDVTVPDGRLVVTYVNPPETETFEFKDIRSWTWASRVYLPGDEPVTCLLIRKEGSHIEIPMFNIRKVESVHNSTEHIAWRRAENVRAVFDFEIPTVFPNDTEEGSDGHLGNAGLS